MKNGQYLPIAASDNVAGPQFDTGKKQIQYPAGYTSYSDENLVGNLAHEIGHLQADSDDKAFARL